LLNNLIKNNCVVINNINGNISKIIEGELIKDKYIVKKIPTLIFLKNSSSVSKLIIKTKHKTVNTTYKKDLKKIFIKNFI
tara:strand:+ start:329 stop:568 length:240 start_codon:yes stop_codon:yes gene_type:complete